MRRPRTSGRRSAIGRRRSNGPHARDGREKVKELEGLIHQWAKDMTDPKWPSRPPPTFSVCGTPFTLPV